jgi:predicted nucleic acid-binding protein
MPILLDTSILGRLANHSDPMRVIASTAIGRSHLQRESFVITSRNLVEFSNFATRPVAANGLGLSSSAAQSFVDQFEQSFPLLEETPDIFPGWKKIVQSLGVVGKQVHDARLVAVCHVHAILKLMTFNVAHFARFSGVTPGIVVIDPATV